MKRPVRDALALGILGFLTFGIGALDCATGPNVSLWFVYVLPICLAAAIGGVRAGLAFSLVAAALLVAVGTSVGHHFPSPAYFYFDVFGDFFTYLVVVALALGVRERLHHGLGELLPSAEVTAELQRVVARQAEDRNAAQN